MLLSLTQIEPGIEVTCEEEFMRVDLERANFRNFDPSYLHLNYQRCRATANSTHISLRTSLNDCGTTFNETNDQIRFDNVVKAEKVIVQGVVTRSFDINIKFYCKYSKSKFVQVSFRPFGIVTGNEGIISFLLWVLHFTVFYFLALLFWVLIVYNAFFIVL